MAGEYQSLRGPGIASLVAATIGLFAGGPAGAASAFMTTFATTYSLQAWSMREARKASLADVAERKTMVRTATGPHRYVYGQTLVSGPMVYVQVTGSDKEYLNAVICLAGHEIHSIGDVWIEDIRTVRNTGTGAITAGGGLGGLAWVWEHLGTTSQTADATLITESGGKWTSNHRLRGLAYLYARLKFDQDKLYAIPNVRVVVRGKKCYDPRDGGTRLTDNPALILRDYLTADYGLACASSEVDDSLITAAANVCDEWVDTGVTGVTASVDYTNGYFTFATVDGRFSTGDKVTLSGTVPTGFSTGGTYYVILVGGTTFRLASSYQNAIEGTAITPSGGTPSTVTLATLFQKRYTLNGTVTADQAPKDVVEDMLGTMAGSIVWSGGKWCLYAGAYVAPTVSLGADDLVGGVTIRPRKARHELVNQIRGTFVDVARIWTQSEYPPVGDATYISNDGGLTIERNLDQPFVDNAFRAQRLAKIALRRARAGTLSLRVKIHLLKLAGNDTVSVTIPQLGLSSAVYRITQWRLSGGQDGLGVDLSLVEESADHYAWSASDAVAPVPTAAIDVPQFSQPVVVPTGLTVASGNAELLAAGDGTIVSRMRITWTAAKQSGLLGYEIQYKRTAESNYVSVLAASDQGETWVAPVEDGTDYDVRIRTIAAPNSRRSAWVSTTHTVAGKTAAPTAPTSFTVTAAISGYDLAVSQSPDADYAATEIWEATSNNRAAAALLVSVAGTRFARAGLPSSVSRWYWCRHVDRSGNVSAWYPSGATSGVTAVTLAPSGGLPTVPDATVITGAPGTPPPGGDAYWAVFDDTTGKIWRWSETAGAYTKAADGGDIAAGTIAADKIAVANLAAISANLGAITGGSLDIGSGKFSVDSSGNVTIRSAASGARLEVTNSVIRVYDGSGVLRVKLGDLA